MTQPEARLKKRIMDALKARGFFVMKIAGGPGTLVGMTDLIVCVEGLFIGLEIKRPETRTDVSLRQQFVHAQIKRAGGIVAVVCSPKEALDACDRAIRLLDQRRSSHDD